METTSLITENVKELHNLYKELQYIRKRTYEIMCRRVDDEKNEEIASAVRIALSSRANMAFKDSGNLIIEMIQEIIASNIVEGE